MRAIVVCVDSANARFAVETGAGFCAVLCQLAGPQVLAGDILCGDVYCRGPQDLSHPDGVLAITEGSGPISRTDALQRLGRQRSSDCDTSV